MLFLLLACNSGEDAAPSTNEANEPAAPLQLHTEDPIAAFRTQLGLMAKDDGSACQAIDAAWSLASRAKTDAALAETLESTPGFRTSDAKVGVDWVELARASSGGSMEVALVTVGGIEAQTRRDCIDPRSLANWLGRHHAIGKVGDCSRASLTRILGEIVAPLPQRPCVCNLPEKDPIPSIVESLDALGLPSQPFADWPKQPGWKACPVDQATEPSPPR